MRNVFASLIVAAVTLASSSAFAGNGGALLQYLPSDTRLVVSADVASIRGTDSWTHLSSFLSSNASSQDGLQRLVQAGFDPRTDAQTMMLASSGDSVDRAEDAGVLLIEGRFDRARVEQAVQAEFPEAPQTLGAVRYFGDANTLVALLSDSVIVIGSRDGGLAAVSVAAGQPQNAGISSQLASQIGDVNTSEEIWFALLNPSGEPFPTGTVAVRGHVDLSAGCGFGLLMITGSEQTASTTVSDINTAIQQALATPEVAAFGMEGVLRSVSATAEGANVRLVASVDRETWNTLVATLAGIMAEELR